MITNNNNSPIDSSGTGKLIITCCISLFICIIIAWGIIPTIFGLQPFDEGGFKTCFFLAVAPGIIIGLIVYHTLLKNNSNPSIRYNQDSQSESSNMRHLDVPNNTSSASERLIELKKLLDEGILTQDEFNSLKATIIDQFKV